jgi:DNA polymerase
MPINTKDLFGDTEKIASTEPQYHDARFYPSLMQCRACTCRAEASKVVPGVGPKSADFIFLGRNPGKQEDRLGAPFVGPGGEELNRMIDVLGLDRLKVAIFNAVKCHTLNDRPPKPIEIETCTTLWFQKELEYFDKASIIFPMGREAISVMLGPDAVSPAKREGYWMKVIHKERVLHVCPLNHPGYLLRARSYQMQMHNTTLPAVKLHLLEHFREAYERSRTA